MWYKNMGTTFFRFVTIHAFDIQTDRRPCNTVSCITCSRTVKTGAGIGLPTMCLISLTMRLAGCSCSLSIMTA